MSLSTDEILKHDKAAETVDRICDQYLAYSDLSCVFVGEKSRGGTSTGELAICFAVAAKGQFRKEEEIPASIDGFPTDVIEDGPGVIEETADIHDYRPVVGGARLSGVANNGITYAATAGMVVPIGRGSYILTAGHYLRGYTNRQSVINQFNTRVGLPWSWLDTDRIVQIGGTDVRKYVDAGVISLDRAVNRTEYNLVTVRGPAPTQASAAISGAYNITPTLINKNCTVNGSTTAGPVIATIESITAAYTPVGRHTRHKCIRIRSLPLVPVLARSGDSGTVAYMGTLGTDARAIGMISAGLNKVAYLSAIDGIDVSFSLDLDFINCPP